MAAIAVPPRVCGLRYGYVERSVTVKYETR